jgi:hypothetical protein
MTLEQFKTIMLMDSDPSTFDDDCAFLGLQIIRKYCPKEGISGADHDIIWSVDIKDLVDAGITDDDAIQLRLMNWMIWDNEYLALFV